MKETEFVYIDNEAALAKASEEWKKSAEIAVDIECENNLHHYGVKISLVQVSTENNSWIVDALKIKDFTSLVSVFENTAVQKIFHDINFDLRIIHTEMKCEIRNIFDTQIAALLLGKKELGLGALLKENFGIEKNGKFQKADWTKRPLSEEMLSYATNDTKYLIRLKNILKKELVALGRLSWTEQEFLDIEKRHIEYNEQTFSDIKDVKHLTDKERAIFFRLYNLREDIAKSVDRPVYFVINNRRLIEICQNPPPDISEWKNMRGVHPVVRAKADLFYNEVNRGKKEELSLPVPEKKRFSPAQRNYISQLSEKSDRISEELGIQKYLILSQDQIKEIVISGNKNCLREWQKELLKLN